MENNDAQQHDELSKLVKGYCERVRADFENRLSQWPFDMAQNQSREVIGALLSRQTTLARQMALSPGIWNGHAAPLILRAMADVHITLAWILTSPSERAEQFILYGLGQQKLELEHRKAQMTGRDPESGESELVEALENWLNRQRAEFLTEVNLGSWSGKNTRQMAEEAGCIDFYNYVYSPFSACVHSAWHHIARYNLIDCDNPLHGMHRVPQLIAVDSDPHYLYLAAKFNQKSLSAFDVHFGADVINPSSFDWLCDFLKGTQDDIDSE
ncbi:MAG: hypothetical protein ING71_07920 [Rhodocyclaceae bacterium]|nr:hypothetical protein [Rhodocyclaceae bacterium]MCA4910380.1 hypothetical protein [Methylobacterium sp.]